MATERKHNQVQIDPDAIKRWSVKLGFTPSSLQRADVMNRETYNRCLKTGELRNDCFEALVKFIGCEKKDLLAWKSNADDMNHQPYQLPATAEWLIDEQFPASEWMKTPNGLDYRICRMKHRTIENHFGRGKFYDLLSVRQDLREKLKHRLERHAIVGKTITPCEWLPQFYSCVLAGSGEGWWVIDRWVGGRTLLDGIGDNLCIPAIMKGLLNGLDVLHRHDIILRELHPRSVILHETTGSPVIADLEMSKFSDGLPTVRTTFLQHNPYRAPEVDSGQVSPATDIYSWAMVGLFLALGREPLVHSLEREVDDAGFPKPVAEIYRECLLGVPKNRPQKCATVLKSLTRWT